MLTSKLLQAIKNVEDPVLRSRYIKLHQAPQSVREALFSDATNLIIERLIERNDLSDDQWRQTSLAVAKVLLSELHPRELERYLEDALEVDELMAVEIAKEIKNQILAPIKEDLMKLYPGAAAPSAPPVRNTEPTHLQRPQAPHNLPIKPNQSVVTTEKNVVKVEK